MINLTDDNKVIDTKVVVNASLMVDTGIGNSLLENPPSLNKLES